MMSMYSRRFLILRLLIGACSVQIASCFSNSTDDSTNIVHRDLQTGTPYFVTKSLGAANHDITLGNPLRGLASDPRHDEPEKSGIKCSMEVSYVDFSDIVIKASTYDWTLFEQKIAKVSAKKNHLTPRVTIYYPGDPVFLPPDLAKTVQMIPYSNFGGGMTPNYSDPILLREMKNFIYAFGAKYDGDTRLAFIQAGLIGFWGEWWGTGLDPSVESLVLKWYKEAFKITPIQVRYPDKESYDLGYGYHDDSYTYSTIDGIYNGGVFKNHYTYRKMNASGALDFWKRGPFGGEFRPESRDVFLSSYQNGTFQKQDVYTCMVMTRTTYMKCGSYFGNTGLAADTIQRANWYNARMGYSFQITEVSAIKSTSTQVDIRVVVTNIGLSRFYYPLSLGLSCSGIGSVRTVAGVETVMDINESKAFTLTGIPATAECLKSISFSLVSKMLYPDRPIKFAQGSGFVTVSIPLPSSGGTAPVPVPVPVPVFKPAPVPVPVPVPVFKPAPVPVQVPVPVPVSKPAPVPVPSPGAPNMILALVNTSTKNEYALAPGSFIDLKVAGSSLTMLAKIIVPKGSKVQFTWNDGKPKVWTEGSAPYAIGLNSPTYFTKLDYLSTTGPKTVTCTALSSSGVIIATQTMSFNIV